jgi:hypothetical protein
VWFAGSCSAAEPPAEPGDLFFSVRSLTIVFACCITLIANHAADFWLGVGADPKRALRVARFNFANRSTPRARALLSRAIAAQTA